MEEITGGESVIITNYNFNPSSYMSATFTADTKVIGRVGEKPSTSGSTVYIPLFEHMNYDAVYMQFVIPGAKSKEYLESVKTLGILGSSVVGVHTHNLMELVDEVAESAQVTNHGNCLVNRDGKTTLHSTDVAGMMNTLLPLVGTLEDKEVVILGGGALMPGILNELAKHKTKSVVIYNRTIEKAKSLVSDFSCTFGGDLEELVAHAKGDVFINATHIGSTSCDTGDECFTDEFLKRFSVVQDVTYLPPESKWALRAKELGLKVGFGGEMFAHQGAHQLRLIAGFEPDMDFLIPLVKKGLGG